MSDLAAPRDSAGLPAIGRLSSDERLTRRAAEGDSRAFAAIYRRYSQDLYRYCMAILGDSQEAQDALQNTMVKVMRALPDERREIRLKPWLYRIAHNEAIDLVRSRRPVQELDAELEGQGLEPSEQAEQRARLQRLLIDLEDLPERQRGALLMRELAGLSFEEIGESLGATPAVVRQTIYEARLNLKQMNAGRETSCTDVMRALSDADGRVVRRRDMRAHLRHCEGCRAFRDQIKERRTDLAAIAPLPAATAAGILHALLGGHGPGSGGGILGALSGGASKAVGGSMAVKSAAAVVAVAVVGAGVADRSGLIHLGSSGGANGAGASTAQEDGRSPASGAGALRVRAAARGAAAHDGAAGARRRQAASHLGSSSGSAGRGSAQATAGGPPGAPGSSGSTLAEDHAQSGHAELPVAAGKGQETAASHQGEGEATSHPAAPEHPTASEHPAAESHPGGQAPPTPPPVAPAETG
ncbi:MAG TPA: sigma-70 family RNA polymerase sigma factor, partial [Solirubrobacterales bacterium]